MIKRVATVAPFLLAASCTLDERPATVPASEAAGLPDASYRRDFLAQVAAMPDGDLKETAYYYADMLYEADDVRASFVAEDGGTFDCIDGARQPSLRKPDGTFESPAFATERDPLDPDSPPAVLAPARAGSCPRGSIRRAHPADHAFARFVAAREASPAGGKMLVPQWSHDAKWYGSAPYQANFGGYEHARATQSITNHGISSRLAVYMPTIAVSGEHSISQLWLMGQNATDCALAQLGAGTCESVETGWVQRTGVGNPMFFVYSTPDNYASPGYGCWVDQGCPTWVGNASSPIQPGDLLDYSSVASQHPENQEVELRIRQTSDGNWHVYTGDAATGVEVGYFKSAKHFTQCKNGSCVSRPWFTTQGLANASNLIRYGGEIINLNSGSTTGQHTATQMGTGYLANQAGSSTTPAAYQHQLLEYPDYQGTGGVKPSNLDVSSASSGSSYDNDYNNPGCYSLTDSETNTGTPWPNWGSQEFIFFGGAGYNSLFCK